MSIDFLALAAPGVHGLTPYRPGKPVEELEREYGVTGAVKLASNENPLGPSPRALEAITETFPLLGRYPDGAGFALKRALADRLNVDPAGITLGNGSNEVLELVARAFLTPESEVVFSEHAFAVYPLVTQAAGARAVVTPARDYGNDLDALAAAVTPRTRIVFIANPNNPTGTWLGRAALEAFLDRVPRSVVVVVDEAYCEYVDAANYPNALEWLPRFPNLLVARTFSKIHGLAALRIGYGVCAPVIAEILNRVRQPFNVNGPALAAAEAALADEAHVAASRRVNLEGLTSLAAGCDRLGLAYIPSVGNFLTIDLARPAAPVYESLLREGVIVRPIANYGLPRHLRVTVGLPGENMRFLAALERVLAAAPQAAGV